MAMPALATDYIATFTVDKVEVINGVNTWASAQTFVLNKTQSHNYLGMTTVTFTDIDTTQSPIQISLTTTGSGATTGFVLISGQTKSIKGSYATNASASNIDDTRINLVSLVPYATTTYYNGTTSPFNAYISTNNQQLSLTRNPTSPTMDSFDASKYYTSQNSGWSGSGQRNEVDVYFVRQANIGGDVSVIGKSSSGAALTTPAYQQDSNQIEFNIITNGIYTFTVKYSNTNSWGYTSDVTDLYVLKVDGITSTSSTTPIYSTTPYETYVGDTKTISMTVAGTFATVAGVTITPLSNNTFNFVFGATGIYSLVYTTDSGQTAISFNVIQKPVIVATPIQPQPAATVAVNQAQGENGVLGIPNMWLFGGLGLVIIGIVYSRKNKGNGGSNHYESKKNLG
jgi:hypothetical protein